MLRSIVGSALRTAISSSAVVSRINLPQRAFASFNNTTTTLLPRPALTGLNTPSTSIHLLKSAPLQQQSVRSLTKFSLIKGKRKSVKAVVKRFKRLDWGAWIRTYTGRQKKLFKKSPALRRRLRQHVFTNSTQSWLLDKMVTNFWRRPKYYVDDPYAPYHKRDEYFATKSKTFKV